MLKGGVIMDVTDAEQARIAEEAGACAVMALERVPADIRAQGGVARMANTAKIREIQEAVTIPVMAKARIGHFVEAQVLEALEVDYIDESEVLTPADEANHIDKWAFKRAVRVRRDRPRRGAAADRRGRGDDPHEGRGGHRQRRRGRAPHARDPVRDPAARLDGPVRSWPTAAKELRAPLELVRKVAEEGGLPVVNFSAGGLATPADAALMMQLGAEGVFVGSGIFKSSDPPARARAIVHATTHYEDPTAIAEASEALGEAMAGLDVKDARRAQPAPASWLVASSRRLRPAGRAPRAPRIGVLAIQGDFEAHCDALERLGARAVEVRRPAQLDALDGLVDPRRGEHDDADGDRGLRPRAAACGTSSAAGGPCSAPAPG